MSLPAHRPVLLAEVVELMRPRPGGRYVDGTVNGGGHAGAILRACAPDGLVLGIDRDPELLTALRRGPDPSCDRLQLACGDFRELDHIVAAQRFAPADGVLLDLGVSSYHLDCSNRGFSFASDEPLDMRFDPSDPYAESAAAILASRSAEELTSIFRTYGEERYASRIARTIVARRRQAPLCSTGQLLAAIEQSLPAKTRWRAARHAARIFQALRIAANDELEAIAQVLPQALSILKPAGRLLVISFHSLEDRLVKNFLRDQQAAGHVRVATRKPIQPSSEEVEANPRAASAKLRAAERIRE